MGRLKTIRSRVQPLRRSLPKPAEPERMSGRAAVDRRARWLQVHPLCCMCEREGKVRLAQVVDHITPLWAGGADDYDSNGQSLCNEHHDAKTAREAGERVAGGYSDV